MKKIDTGNPTFEKLITEGNVYVDKTRYLYDLLTDGGTYYFCARPRRFGKTLTVNTLEEIFKGHRSLFKGLYINLTDYDWKEHPVIHIDFGKCQKATASEFKAWLNRNFIKIGQSYNVKLEDTLDYDDNFDTLIEELSKKGSIVILIDEYDKMLSSNIYNPEVEAIREVLKGFFEIIKACYRNLRFVFITGVTRYAKLSVFSSMNNLRDISMSDEYATMFGYTQKELEDNFREYIEKGVVTSGLSRDEYLSLLKNKYDGYRFAVGAETVYNPVSVGSFFVNGGKAFNNYWAETGSMKLLMDIAQKVNFNIATSLEKPIVASNLSSFDVLEMTTGDVDELKYEALLLQTGYLTIKTSRFNGNELFLDFPNEEVMDSYASNILGMYGRADAVKRGFYPNDLKEQFEEGNTKGIIDNLFSVYAAIPYREGQKQIEADYQGMFYAMMIVIHAEVYLEVLTNKGRIDAVVKTSEHVYVIEFKKDESAKKALEQIKDKCYYEQYKAWSNNSTRKVHLLGINFSTKERNISEWKEDILEI